MSIEAYRIAVKVALVENVSRGLQLMSRHFKAVDLEARAFQERIKGIELGMAELGRVSEASNA
ncbi:hypothetical protein, partial [Bacillus thuringiensis]|uniref:hypothetical protein n=1 Tax=Bacillus thuringiensis TaxID=1428 RepID=UPI002175DD05